jgi:hypothetical protein
VKGCEPLERKVVTFPQSLLEMTIMTKSTWLLIFIPLAITGPALVYLPAPYIWILLSWGVALVLAAITGSRPLLRLLCFNAGVLGLVLCGWEAGLWIIHGREWMGHPGRGFHLHAALDHDVLGYALEENTRRRAVKHQGDSLVYNVVYTVDHSGLRMASPFKNERIDMGAVLFFGGSFTYGEGVNDNETLPYVAALLSEGRFAVYNFGVHGYGPQHMLAAIENGLVKARIRHVPRFALYQALTGHVARAAGLVPWVRDGPKYVINKAGDIVHVGRFDDGFARPSQLRLQLDKSRIVESIRCRQRPVREKDVALFAGIIDKARTLLGSSYPGLEFHVLYWDREGDRLSQAVLQELTGKGIRVHLVSRMLPGCKGIPEASATYTIPMDGHPNALAHRLVAQYVVSKILLGKETHRE